MSVAPPTASCPLCSAPLPAERPDCPACSASPHALDLINALDFVVRRFEQWLKEGQLKTAQHQAIAASYVQLREDIVAAVRAGRPLPTALVLLPATQCWSCLTPSTGGPVCERCGAPLEAPAVRSVRYLNLLAHEIVRQEQARRLSLTQAHALTAEVRGRIAALRQRLDRDRILMVQPVRRPRVEEALLVVEPVTPRRPVLEVILDPKNIQWLLTFGGGLLVFGLVIWLATQGLFQNPKLIAGALGVANGALLLGGWFLIRATRYQVGGRAVTLLACLVMPLNLWFYDANNLITVQGQLWLPALVCCVLYAASALILRDALFVPVLMGGVAMTGLLILADSSVGRFWEIAAPATLLVGLGAAGVLAERVFPKGEGPFSRQGFGLAFFWSGHALLAAGLLLVLGAQLTGWFYEPFFRLMGVRHAPAIVTDHSLKLLALGLFLVGSAVYLWSDLVVRRVGVYIYLAAFTLLWSEMLALLALDVVVASEVIVLVLALTARAVNLLQATGAAASKLGRTVAPLGLLLSLLPVLFGVVLHFRATSVELNNMWLRADRSHFVVTWGYVGAMLVTALCCRLGAFLYRHRAPGISVTYFFLTGAATLVGAAALASVLGLKTWETQAPVLMLLPIAYLSAARLYRGHTAEAPLVWVAHSATIAMMVTVVGAALQYDPRQVFTPLQGKTLNLLLALFWAEAALFYVLAGAWQKQGFSIYAATACVCGAVWQLLHFLQIGGEYHAIAFALVGLVLLIGYRFAVLERYQRGGLADAAFQCANGLLSLSFVAAVLLTLTRLVVVDGPPFVQREGWQTPLRGLLVVLIVLAAVSLLAAVLVQHAAWRRWYAVVAVVEGVLTFLVLNRLSELSPWQKVEVFCVVLGLVLLALGHWGWYREAEERQSDLVSLSLSLGSVLVSLSLIVAVLVHRSTAHFSTLNELGLLVLGLLLLTTGVMLQLKSTAIAGGVMVGLFVVSLPMFLRTPAWLENLEGASLWMIFGGGTVFLIGLLLSVCRDRLLALPEKIKRREGIFRLLSWR